MGIKVPREMNQRALGHQAEGLNYLAHFYYQKCAR
jgi:hypothetical protein